MKTILLFDPRFPDRRPTRLTLADELASAAVRSGIAAAANPNEAGVLAAGGPLDSGSLTPVVVQHGINQDRLARTLLPLSVVMVGAQLGVLASIGLPIGLSGPIAPSFIIAPAIYTDGSPTVGEIVALDFGAIAGDTMGTRQILRADNSVIAEVTTGSYQLANIGQIKLRVYAKNTAGLYADTPIVTVAAAPVSSRSAPTLSFPDDRVAGTNPPVVQFASDDGSIDKNTDNFEFKYTVDGVLTTGSVSLAEMTQTEDYYYTVPSLDDLAAGEFGIQGRFTGPDGSPSPWSPILTDTLSAKALPAASTKWSTVAGKRSPHATVDPNGRDAIFENTGGNVGIACDTPRSDARRADLVFTKWGYRGGSVGIMDATRNLSEYDKAGEIGAANRMVVWRDNGEIFSTDNEFAGPAAYADSWSEADVLGILQEPVMSGSTQVGLRVRFNKNGSPWSDPVMLTVTSTVFVAFSKGDSICRLNTGQQAIAVTAPAIRWN